jgi:hypothetical protein
MKNLKWLRTGTLVAVLLFALVLWWTREFDYPSQSYSAAFSNVIFYYFMHISIIFSFWLDFADSKIRIGRFRWFSFLPVIFGALVILWDMHLHPMKHNLATAALMVAAVFNLIYYAQTSAERVYASVIGVAAGVMFPIGMFTEVSLFWTEVIAEACIGIGLARRIYLEDYAK